TQQLRHEAQRQIDLVSAVAAPPRDSRLSFAVAAHERDSLLRKLAVAGIDWRDRPIVVHPGASAPSRRYPAERYAEVVSEVLRAQPRPIVITGDGEEAQVCAYVAAKAMPAGAARVHDLAGQLSLGELGALIEGAGALVSNNTG